MNSFNKNLILLAILPGLIFIIIFSLVPTFLSFTVSLFKINFFEASRFVGLKNFVKLFSDKYFYQSLLNSLIYLFVTPILAFISLSLAILIKELSSKQQLLKTIYFIPLVTPVVISGIVWRYIFNEDSGLLNYRLTSFFNQKIHWLSSYPENIISVMILTI